MYVKRCVWWVVLALAALVCLGCKPAVPADGKPVVVVTTTMLEDMTCELGGDAVAVRGLMRPGGDPHLYQPTPQDAALVASSALVITSGHGLEGWVDDLVRNAGGQRPVVVAGQGVDVIRDPATGAVDPHFWFDVTAWQIASDNVAGALVNLAPAQADAIRTRHAKMKARLSAQHDWIKAQLGSIPAKKRVLVTSHDAFHYFGRAYGLDVIGLQGLSTEQQAGQRDLVRVIEQIKARSIPAVFTETTVNPQLIERIAADTGVKKLGPLYSDSLGAPGSGAETYSGMMSLNVRMITEGLGGTYAPFMEPTP
jgi:ABC-type Zn uptake system ZnuABC Zn-binding protein ZnuA